VIFASANDYGGKKAKRSPVHSICGRDAKWEAAQAVCA
jgi:hypothetical protein